MKTSAFISVLLPLLCLAGHAVTIDSETQWPVIIDDNYGEVVEDVDIRLSGKYAIDARGMFATIHSQTWSPDFALSFENAGIIGTVLQITNFKSLSFTNSGAMEGGSGLIDATVINQASSNNDARIDIDSVAEGVTFTNNGKGGSQPMAALWAYSEWAGEPGDGSINISSYIGIQQAGVTVSDNNWGHSAVYSGAKGSLTPGVTDNINNQIEFATTERVSFTDNVSQDSLIQAHTVIDSVPEEQNYGNATALVIFRNINDTLELVRNTSHGSYGGAVSAVLEMDPLADYYDRSAGQAHIIFTNNGTVRLADNSTAGHGGAIASVIKTVNSYAGEALDANKGLTIQTYEGNFTVENNHAGGKGGGAYVEGGSVMISADSTYDTHADIIFKGNTMGDRLTGDLIANALYATGNEGYIGGIADLRAMDGNRVVFDGSVISRPTGERILEINRPEMPPARREGPYPGMYTGTVLFTGETVRQTIGPKQSWESDEHYRERLTQSLTSDIDQDVAVYAGTLAVQRDAVLKIRSLALLEQALQYDGVTLNTDFNGLIYVQGNADFAGIAKMDIKRLLLGTPGAQAITMRIDGMLEGHFELMNHGDLYAEGLLERSMEITVFKLTTLDTDVTGLTWNIDEFNAGLGETVEEDQWKMKWVVEDTAMRLVLYTSDSVPEPSTALLALAAMAGAGIRRRIRHS